MEIDHWMYTSAFKGESGNAGYQTIASSRGVTSDEKREMERIVPLNTPKEPECNSGLLRLESGRWALFKTSQGGQDEFGRGTVFSEAYVIGPDDIDNLPLPPYLYLLSDETGKHRNFRGPLTREEVLAREREPLEQVSTLVPPAEGINKDWAVRFVAKYSPLQRKHLAQTLNLEPAQKVLFATETDDAVAAFGLLWETASPQERGSLGLTTRQVNAYAGKISCWPQRLGRPTELEWFSKVFLPDRQAPDSSLSTPMNEKVAGLLGGAKGAEQVTPVPERERIASAPKPGPLDGVVFTKSRAGEEVWSTTIRNSLQRQLK